MNGWHVIRCTPGSENRAVDKLTDIGCDQAWYYTREESNLSGAQRRAKKRGEDQGPSKREVAELEGYIFAQGDIDPEKIREQSSPSLWLSVLVVNGKAVVIPDEEMMQMKQVPPVLRARLDAIQAAERAERLAKIPQIGERATVVEGRLAGYDGIVKAIKGDSAALDVGGLIRQIVVPLAYVERASSQQCA